MRQHTAPGLAAVYAATLPFSPSRSSLSLWTIELDLVAGQMMSANWALPSICLVQHWGQFWIVGQMQFVSYKSGLGVTTTPH